MVRPGSGGAPAAYSPSHPEALDARGPVATSVGGLAVERDGRVMLIDAGLGSFTGDITVGAIFVGSANSGALPDVLGALGRSPADIDTVAFTHLHVDHTGWAFVRDGNGAQRKFFPAARYLVAADEWAPHARGELIPGAPSRAAVIEPLGRVHTLSRVHILISHGEEIFPGVRPW